MADGAACEAGDTLHSWPRLRATGGMVDASRPATLGERYACTMFVELPRTETVIAIEEGAARLEMRVHGRALLHAGIWINRGVLAPGYLADVNLIDFDNLSLPQPEYVNDLPNGAGRYIQGSTGYDYTIVNGDVFMDHGTHTGTLAGRLVRSGR